MIPVGVEERPVMAVTQKKKRQRKENMKMVDLSYRCTK
jgi:hypothetical protein